MAHILLIEDDRSQILLMRRWLADHQLDVLTDGLEAQRALATGSWDLIISDVQLPGLDGLTLLRTGAARHTPTVLITGHTEFEVALGAMQAGAADLLPKPFTGAQVRATVERVLAARAAKSRRILAIGAHPDDVEIGIGGILARHDAAGDAVTILTVSRGAAGGATDVREREAHAAANVLGAHLVMDDLTDRHIDGGPKTIGAIEQIIRSFGADVVYTHSAHDRHQDHRGVHEATTIAARGVAEVYAYQSPSSTIDFQPARFVDVSDVMALKLRALQAYASQAGRPYLAPDVIQATASYWGRFADYRMVEPLEIVRDSRFAA